MTRLSPDQIADLKARHPVPEIAGALVRLRAARGQWTHRGPCPICSPKTESRTAARFECNAERWTCANCQDGGDVIRLVARINNLDQARDFGRIVALLGGPQPIDEAEAARRRQAAEAKRQRQEAASARYRERERLRLYRSFWRLQDEKGIPTQTRPWPGTPVESYLRGRGLDVPHRARLRFHPDMPLFADGREDEPRLLHRGPAMLAAIMAPDAAGVMRFSGLHITWLDPNAGRVSGGGVLSAGNKGKLAIVDPETGERVLSRKVRGHKAGGFIDLGDGGAAPDAPGAATVRMFAGEGIESVLAVYTALRRSGKLRALDLFRSGVDLGNLAGRALDRLPHPTQKTDVVDKATGEVKARRTLMVPGVDPDLESDAMPVPADVDELVLLGDGDSDPFSTRCAMARAAKRHARAITRSKDAPTGAAEHPSFASCASGADLASPLSPAAGGAEIFSADASCPRQAERIVRVIWPRPGLDFNDMLQATKESDQ